MCINYEVIEWKYLWKIFKKDLEKKYKQAFDISLETIKISLINFSTLENIKPNGIILKSKCNNYVIWKFDFKIAWQHNTKWRDEYRYICFVDKNNYKAYILLIYSKNYIWDGDKKCAKQNETWWWKCLVKKYYPDFWNYFV